MGRDTEELQKLGFAAFRAGRFAEAEGLIAEALMLNPHAAELWNNRGSILAMLKRHAEAVSCFGRALDLQPAFSGARANRANAHLAARRYDEAARDYEILLAREPDWPYARGNLVFCRLQMCDWNNFVSDGRAVQTALEAGKRAVPPALSAALLTSRSLQHRASEIIAAEKFPRLPPLWRGEAYSHARPRIAYLSADFHAHATAALTAGLFESHDRTRFETYGFSFGPDDASPMRARLRKAFEHFIDVAGESDAEIAARMRAFEIDIAVDLKGYTSDARPGIFAHKAAPVQVNYLGFPATMGTTLLDYIVADPVIIPCTDDVDYSEKTVRLPETYQPNDGARAIAEEIPSRAAAGLPGNGFVFCCFNAPYKLTPEVFTRWMRLLRGVDNSVLWLLQDNPFAAANLRREAEAQGVAATRIIFADRIAPEDHLARHTLADLFLDTLPYNAHTTASDALWAGLPVLALPGETFASRVGASLLTAMGMPELIAQSAAEYERKALALARDPAALGTIRAKLKTQRLAAPLFDTARYTRHLERAFETMMEKRRRGLPPAGFDVEPLP